MNPSRAAYLKLSAIFEARGLMRHANSSVLTDLHATTPPRAQAARGEVCAVLQSMGFASDAASEIEPLLAAVGAADGEEFTAEERANVREMRNVIAKTRTPVHRVAVAQAAQLRRNKAMSAATAAGQRARWTDWGAFLPHLTEGLAAAKDFAAVQASTASPSASALYETMLREHAEGATLAGVDALYADLKLWVPPMAACFRGDGGGGGDATAVPSPRPETVARFTHENVTRFCTSVLQGVGYDFTRGRLEVATNNAHPFTSRNADDARVVVRLWRVGGVPDIFSTFDLTIHEAGHALAEQHRPGADSTGQLQPVSQVRCTATHESQSVFFEEFVGRDPAFQPTVSRWLTDAFGDDPAFAPDALRRRNWFGSARDGDAAAVAGAGGAEERGRVRNSATKFAQLCAIVDLERRLVTGAVAPADAPAAFAAIADEWMGGAAFRGDDDGRPMPAGARTEAAAKVLATSAAPQWAQATFGYFHAYVLAAVYGAQYEAAIRRHVGGVDAYDALLARGDLAPLAAWLRERVWAAGSRHESAEAVVLAATRRPRIDTAHYRRVLERRHFAADVA